MGCDRLTIMKYIYLPPILLLFSLSTLVKIFKKASGLEDGCYDLFEINYADGSFNIYFNYPTDFDEKQALKLVDEIAIKVNLMSLVEIERFVNGD